MFLFYRLLLAHFIADFPLQSAKIYRMKPEPRGSLLHGAIFVFTAILLSFPFLHHALMWDFLILFGIAHSLQDWVKIELCLKYKINNLGIFLLDQLLHIGVLATVLLSSMSREIPTVSSTFMEIYKSDIVIIYAIGYVISTFGGTVIMVYLKKMFLGEETEVYEELPPTEKYYGTSERILITTLVVLEGNYFMFIPILPLIRYLVLLIKGTKNKKIKWKESTIEIFLSPLIAVFIGLILRFIL